MSVGIQFFPLDGIAPQSCTADYRTPEVELGLLPGNAGAVVGAMQKHQPTSFTPTAPALSGAIAHMKEWAQNHPYHAPVVVLVTDGFPTECDPRDITGVAEIAKTGLDTEPKVYTVVVGLNLGVGGSSLNELAAAGGTNKAFFINGGDIASQFVDAMLNIRLGPQVCRFDVPTPAGQILDISQVAVTYYSPDTMQEAQVPQLEGPGDCALHMDEGWFYDSPTRPTKIELCSGTCGRMARDAFSVSFGCIDTGISR
jgi:hypothetical protein